MKLKPPRAHKALPLALTLAVMPSGLSAQELPDPVRAMLEAAIATGDADKVETVAELARQTNPDGGDTIDTLVAEFEAEQAELAQAEAAAEQQALRERGIFDGWTGEGQVGGLRATGNTEQLGLTAGAKLERKGIDWRHKLSFLADYQENNGITSREQYRASYEPNYKLNERVFLYGLAQYESDRFQGYDARYSVSGGVGLTLIDQDDMQLSIKGGPAWRRTDRVDGTTDEMLAALAALDFDWQIAERLKLFEDASAFYQAGGSTFTSRTGIEADLGSGFSARLSYAVEHETDPEPGSVATDTLTRFTLVYGF